MHCVRAMRPNKYITLRYMQIANIYRARWNVSTERQADSESWVLDGMQNVRWRCIQRRLAWLLQMSKLQTTKCTSSKTSACPSDDGCAGRCWTQRSSLWVWRAEGDEVGNVRRTSLGGDLVHEQRP